MKEELIDTIQHNIIVDLRKKEIDAEDKKQLIEDYMKKHKLTFRELAKEFGIPHTTLYYWTEPEKKKEQAQHNSNTHSFSELNEIKDLLSNYLDEVKKKGKKVKEKDKKVIVDLKEIIDELVLRTMKLKV